MQVIAVGKWSKMEKRWRTVVALRRAASGTSRSRLTPSDPGKVLRLRPRKDPDSL